MRRPYPLLDLLIYSPSMATQTRAPVWWPMLIFMTFIHIFTVWATIYWRPIHAVSTYSLVLSVLLWRITGYMGMLFQFNFSWDRYSLISIQNCGEWRTLSQRKRTPNISKIGYHRFYSHRAFRATFAVRVIIAALGMAASQGSIKVYIATLQCHLNSRLTCACVAVVSGSTS
jgi:hypothetical protein